MMLTGEDARRQWSIYLTEEEAAVPAALQLAYQNAVVVSPEASDLVVSINGRRIVQEKISSPDGVRSLTLQLAAGLLQAGSNRIDVRASQRHRTDCDVRSTYELWTSIDPSATYLDFSSRPAVNVSAVEAVRSVGVDTAGNTAFGFLMPAMGQPGAMPMVMRLVQGLSLLSGMPNQSFAFSTTDVPASGPGRFGIVIGTATELRDVFPQLPSVAETAPVASMQRDPKTGGEILVLSGPSWQAIAGAVESVVSSIDRPNDVRRDFVATGRWTTPDAPLLFGGERLTLAQLGVESTEFPGRRLRTGFNIAVPADFYANAYGEARLLLDAGFTEEVLPGSHVDVYVNGSIASTTPITSVRGGIFRHLPVKVPLRHIKPGVNAIEIEAVLETAADKACAPGASASTTPRFALFDSSEWEMPSFARMGQSPNLSAFSGTGFPYNRHVDPMLLFVDRVDADTMSAAATAMARLALVAGRIVDVESAASSSVIGDRDALFIGAISQMPAKVLSQLSISPTSATSWRPVRQPVGEGAGSSVTFGEWRNRVSSGMFQERITAFQEWTRRNFDMSLTSLQVLPEPEVEFSPVAEQSVVFAQGLSPSGEGTWTAITAPSSADLRAGVDAMAQEARWPQVSGRITAYGDKTGEISSVPVNSANLVQTIPFSLNNYRLVAANWLSTNILTYALGFIAMSLLLGVATAALLSNLGRRP